MFEHLNTIPEVIYNSQKEFGDKLFLKYKQDNQFQNMTYPQFIDKMESLALSLHELNLRKGDKVGIISDNRYQWFIADMAILSLGAVDVPRGTNSTLNELVYILNHSDATLCFMETPAITDRILSVIDKITNISNFILLTGKIEDVQGKKPDKLNIYEFDALISQGEQLKQTTPDYQDKLQKIRTSINREDLATIIYTSGTTGQPKGVMLLHKNIMHNVRVMPGVVRVNEHDRWLSILPVWHIFERTLEYCIMVSGGLMAYSKPDARHLLPDMAEIKPSYMASVPRVWQSIYNGIQNKIQDDSKVKQILFKMFVAVGKSYTYHSKFLRNNRPLFKHDFIFWHWSKKLYSVLLKVLLLPLDKLGDILIFSKIRQKTGGCLVGPISGGGALPEYVDVFFSAIKLEILEGYGLTETSPIVGCRTFGTFVQGTIGKPAPGVEVSIRNEEGKPLSNQHEKGIVYIKGDLVMAGYYNEPEKTAEVLSKDGWLNTGDLGRVTISGELQLLGRAKDTIVLIGGENVEPQPIEDKLTEHQMIHQAMLLGQNQKNLRAIIVPEEQKLSQFAKEQEISYTSLDDLCNNASVKKEYQKIIKSLINPQQGFKKFEMIPHFALVSQVFEVGKELTQTLKMKRDVITNRYGDLVQ